MATDPLNIPAPASPTPQFKDRRPWLIAFGIIDVLFGALGILIALFMFVIDIPQQPGQPALNPVAMKIMITLIYGIPGVYLILMGIGSMRAKNWARIGMLVFSWFWLGIGIISVLMVWLVMPTVMEQAQKTQHSQYTPDTKAVMTVTLLFMSLFFIVLPAIFLRFYHSKSVKATCVSNAPLVPSNSSYPVPIAILVGLMILGVCSLPVMIIWYPYFVLCGHLFEGSSAQILALVFGAWYIALILNLHRLNPIGWWGTLASMLFFVFSAVVTYFTFDMNTLYEKTGQAAMMRQNPLGHYVNELGLVGAAVGLVINLALLMFCRKYIFPSQKEMDQTTI
jgi:hypothetical protein